MKISSQVTSSSSRQPDLPPFGLVLAGGYSRRMGRSKGRLVYSDRDRCQVERCFRLLSGVCPRVYLSVRSDQDPFFDGDRLPRIPDRWEDKGPLGGIVSAMQRVPERAWLVLACDKPFVNTPLLETLVAHRAPSRKAVAFPIPDGSGPDPLCAVYEPYLLSRAVSFLNRVQLSPRALLEEANTRIVEPLEEWRLRDVNTPEAYRAAKRVIRAQPQILDRDV